MIFNCGNCWPIQGVSIAYSFTLGTPDVYLFFKARSRHLSFEWTQIAKMINKDFILIQDTRNGWYQKGLHNLTPNLRKTAKYLLNFVPKKTEKLVLSGGSMGAYAALLFGFLMMDQTDKTIISLSFSPQTLLTEKTKDMKIHPPKRIKFFEETCWGELYKDDFILDLRDVGKKEHKETSFLFYGKRNKEDRYQAGLMHKSTTLVPLETDDHNTSKWLRNKGQLAKVVLREKKVWNKIIKTGSP